MAYPNPNQYKPIPCGVMAGWERIGNSAAFGGSMGTVFDNYVIFEDGKYKMWYSWRPAACIVYAESLDGLQWELPRMVLTYDPESDWECSEVSRPTLVKRDGVYHMWYTGHRWAGNWSTSSIGYATSTDGLHWQRRGTPVMTGTEPWEREMIWCPHVIWNEEKGLYQMWYSGGATPKAEADAIGYATSRDGIHWDKHPENPVLRPDPQSHWEMYKVSACFVWRHEDWYYMTYLGSDSDMRAANGMARSRDGIHWERHPDNPVFGEIEGAWDCCGVCKVTVLERPDGYMAWCNGFSHVLEEMGVLRHPGFDFDFPPEGEHRPSRRGDGSCWSEINTLY